MRLREFAPSPERDDNDDVPDQLLVLANRWWNATDRQPQIEHVLNSLGWSIHQVENEDDAVQLQHRDGTTYFISADDFDPDLFEIARIPQGDFGDKDTLSPMPTKPKTKSLPGGSQFSYAINKKDPEFMEIMIFDGDALVAEMDLGATLDPLKTWQVETIATDPDYRGQGLGKSLYGIALTILKLTVEAGATQTKHGQAMWLMLNSIPGVKVLGYAMDRTAEYRAQPGDKVVDQNDTWTRYTFPVEPGRRSMRSTRRGTGIYSSQYVSMIAKWTGQ
jgi:ribosomal protein S18 acetylase RimI-like enzyme